MGLRVMNSFVAIVPVAVVRITSILELNGTTKNALEIPVVSAHHSVLAKVLVGCEVCVPVVILALVMQIVQVNISFLGTEMTCKIKEYKKLTCTAVMQLGTSSIMYPCMLVGLCVCPLFLCSFFEVFRRMLYLKKA